MTEEQTTPPSEYFQRFDESTSHQSKATIDLEPRMGFYDWLEKFVSPMITLRNEGTFSRIEIIATYPTTQENGSLVMNAFYYKNRPDNKKSYSFGDKYIDIVKLSNKFKALTKTIKKGYPRGYALFWKIHSREIKTQATGGAV